MERTGLSADRLDAYAMAFGLAPLGFSPEGEIGITDEEADVLASLGSLSDASGLFSEAEVLSLFRVLGASLGRMADATLSLFLTDVESPHRQSDGVELPLTKKVFEAVQMLDGFIPALDPMFRRLLLQSIERSRRATIGPRERLQYRYAVGFVDLVGFTEISESMSTTELSTFLREFEGRAYDVVNEAGARVVKLIGDEVMFVATDANSACRAAEALMSGFGTEGAGGSRCCHVAGSRTGRCSSAAATTTAPSSTWRRDSPIRRCPRSCWSPNNLPSRPPAARSNRRAVGS